MVADLAGRFMDINSLANLFIVDGDDNSANPVEDEDVLDIRVVIDDLQDIFHFGLILGYHRTFQNIIDHLGQMGADILLEVEDHLLSMVEVLDNEKNGHGEAE